MFKVETVFKGAHVLVANVQASDYDRYVTISHGLGEPPRLVSLVPLDPAFYASQWVVSTIDASKVVLAKGTAAGSGADVPQVRVQLERPHSMVA